MPLKPLILIHDLGGNPKDWETCGLEAYLVDRGGFDPTLIRRFEFGYTRDGRIAHYDSQGNILDIARRLSGDPSLPDAEAFCVGALADESHSRGGPSKVSIVAWGMGGIIARYYLSRTIPDRWGTRYDGHVDKVVLVGTPNQGMCLESPSRELLSDNHRWRRLRFLARLHAIDGNARASLRVLASALDRVHERALLEMCHDSSRPISLQSLGSLQVTPRSFLLRWLNRPDRAPRGVRFYCLAGQVAVRARVRVLGKERALSLDLGDLLVSERSATTVTGGRPNVFRFPQTYELGTIVPEQSVEPLEWFGGDLPAVSHARLLRSASVHQTILDILTKD